MGMALRGEYGKGTNLEKQEAVALLVMTATSRSKRREEVSSEGVKP